MYSDGTMRCGVIGCKCTQYEQALSKYGIYKNRCICGHTRINHVLNTRDHLFDKGIKC